MQDLQSKVRRMAKSHVPVLIEGETGVGKERRARYLHQLRDTGGSLTKFLCEPAALRGGDNSEEVEICRLEASRKTLLLKRAHRLPIAIQERILWLLDQVNEPVPWLICTTSESVERLAASGQFIPELFYRISAHRLSLPPLRERKPDIPYLFRLALSEISRETGVTETVPDARVLDILMGYSWPGNLWELQNVARAYLLTPTSAALEADIERRQQKMAGNRDGSRLPAALKEQVRQASSRMEGEIILRALEQYRWNRRRTAEALKISYRSLLYKMKNCNIQNHKNGVRYNVVQ
jgi:two-component system response regulator AtoC